MRSERICASAENSSGKRVKCMLTIFGKRRMLRSSFAWKGEIDRLVASVEKPVLMRKSPCATIGTNWCNFDVAYL